MLIERYKSLNFIPPETVADTAALGLKYRQQAGGEGGLSPSQAAKEGVGSGVQRAVNLKNRDKLSPRTIKRMKAFFNRHRKNKAVNPEYKNEPWKDRGYVAWLLWGGDPGESWAENMINKMDKIDKELAKKVAHRFYSMKRDMNSVQ